MVGGQATEQEDCSRFKGNIPHFCKRSPTVVDLLPGTPHNKQVANCCRGGVISSWGQHLANAVASFRLSVGSGGTTNKTVRVPKNFTLMTPGPGYTTCGPAKIVPPSKFLEPDKRRKTQAMMTWKVRCLNSQFSHRTPSRRLSLSVFNNDSSEAADVLISILESWGNPPFLSPNWTGNPCSQTWFGISCSGNSVTEVNLSNMNLSGCFFGNFSRIGSLQLLNLSHNSLTGLIPYELLFLKDLEQLDLSNNNLCGIVPTFPRNVIVKVDANPNIGKYCGDSEPSPKGSHSSSHLALKVALPVSLVVLICIGTCIWRWRKKQTSQAMPEQYGGQYS